MQIKTQLRDEKAIEGGVWVPVFDADKSSFEVLARGFTPTWRQRYNKALARLNKAWHGVDNVPPELQQREAANILFDECVIDVRGLMDGDRPVTIQEARTYCEQLRGAPLYAKFLDAVQTVDARREADAEDLSGNSPPASNGG